MGYHMTRQFLTRCLFAVSVGLSASAIAAAQPVTYTWSAASASLWGTAANWNPATSTTGPGSATDPTNTDTAILSSVGTSTTIQLNFGTIGTPRYLGTIVQDPTDTVARTVGSNSNTAGVLILNGTGANNLIIDNQSVAPLTFAPQAGGGTTGPMTIQLVQANSTINCVLGTSSTNTGVVTISASIGQGASPSGITKGNNGILVLSGTNTFTGPTTVSGGFINYSVPAALYNSTSGSLSGSVNATNLVVQSGGAMIFRVGTGGFATGDFDNIKGLGTATGGFMSGSGIGIDTSLAALTYNGNIADTNGGANSIGFYKFGANTLTLTGNNTYSGGTFIRTGTVAVSGNQQGLPSSGNVTIGDPSNAANTSALTIGSATQTSPSTYNLGSISAAGSGSSALTAISIAGNASPNTTSVTVNGSCSLTRCTVNTIPNATLTINGPLVLQSANGSGSTNSNATFNVGNGTGGTVNYTSSTPISFTATQSGTNAGFLGSRLNNNAGLFTIGTSINEDPNFTAASSGTAQVTFQNAGTLRLTANVPVLLTRDAALTALQPEIMLGTGAGSPAAAGVFDTNGFSTAINTPITTLTASTAPWSVIGGGALTIAGQNSHIGGLTLAAGTTLNINNSGVAAQNSLATSFASGVNTMAVPASAVPNLVLGQRLTGTGIAAGTFIRTIDSVGNTITISQNTTASGTSISAGATSSLGTGTFTINGGTIDNTSGSAVTLATNNAQSWAGDFTFTGTNNLNMGTGAVALTGSRVLTVSAGALTVGGVIGDAGSGFSLTKQGPGALSLGGANTYTGGTVINAGTVQVTGSLAAGAVAVNSPAVFGGTGTVNGPLAIASGATLEPGTSVGPFTDQVTGGAAGILSLTAPTTWAGGGSYIFKYSTTSGQVAGTNYSSVSSTSALDLSGASPSNKVTINIQPVGNPGTPSGPVTYTLGSFTNGGSINGILNFNAGDFAFAGSFSGTPSVSVDANANNLLLTFTPLSSTNPTWTGATSGSWNVTGNWNPVAVPTSGANTQITFGATPNPVMTNDISGGLTLNALTFNSGSPVYSLSGNGLTFQTSISGAAPTITQNSANAVTLNTAVTLTNGLTVSGAGALTLNGAVGGTGSVTMSGTGTLTLGNVANNYAGGTTIQNGTVQVAADAALGTGPVTGAATGTLAYSNTTTTGRSINMNGGTVTVAAGKTVTLNGNAVVSTYLAGSGTFATSAGGAQFVNDNTMPAVSITSNSSADQFFHVNNSGRLTVAAGVNSAGTSTTVNFNGFINQGSGSLTVGANSQANFADFQTYGTLTLNPAALTQTFSQTTLLSNAGASQAYFNGGSRTFLGTPATAVFPNNWPNVSQRGLPTFVAGLDLHGQNAVVAGGLFVNNGYVEDSTNNFQGTATIFADFGSLVKGAGYFQSTVQTVNGGKFQAGNSPGKATFGSFVLGPGGVNNYVFAIDDASGTAGPSPDATGHVSGWGLVKAISMANGQAPGEFTWTATPADKLTVAIDTLVNPTIVGTDVAGPMDHFDPTRAYIWPAVEWTGAYAGPTDATTLTSATTFDTTGVLNPVAGTFGWDLDVSGHTLALTYTPTVVPEPGALAMTTLAGLTFGCAAFRRVRRVFQRPVVGWRHCAPGQPSGLISAANSSKLQ
jgi:autotransporter-associated beta strand protein